MRGLIITTPAEYVKILDAWSDHDTPRTNAPASFIPRTFNPALLARADFCPDSFTLRT